MFHHRIRVPTLPPSTLARSTGVFRKTNKPPNEPIADIDPDDSSLAAIADSRLAPRLIPCFGKIKIPKKPAPTQGTPRLELGAKR